MQASTTPDTIATTALPVADVRDYWQLLKPRVMALVVFSGFTGLMLAPGPLHPVLALTAVFCIALSAGAAGAINMWYERDLDRLMRRTANRPLPQGRIEATAALEFGVMLSATAVLLMGLALNWVAAGLLAVAALFYVFVYTIWLKPRTPQNIVIGGAAGAFPPVIGWAAVTGSPDLAAWTLFLLIFFWTPPHFWALALYKTDDYARARIPMLPNVAGRPVAKRHIFAYSLVQPVFALLPVAAHVCGLVYAVPATILSLAFIALAGILLRTTEGSDAETRAAKRLFAYSILYLFLIFVLMILERLI